MPRKPDPSELDLTDPARGERLQRVMADAGVASRRQCEALIEAGEVEINGEIVDTLPIFVDPASDRIVVEGRPLPKAERNLYVLLNKPARTLSTAADEPGSDRRTVVELVDHPGASRLFPVGRLDYDSVGLLLLTNDGELANRLTHPRYGVPKTYRVVVKGALDEDAVREIEQGIYLAERKAGQTVGAKRTAKVELTLIRTERDKTTLEITLREGRNRQVRRMLAAVGYPVRSLERVAMGPLALKGVARGTWRELTAQEVRSLRKAAAAAGKAGGGGGGKGTSGGPKRSKKKADRRFGSGTGSGAGSGSGSDRRSGDRRLAGKAPVEMDSEEDAGPTIRRRRMKNAVRGAVRRPSKDDSHDTPRGKDDPPDSKAR